ncbi:MAG: hypothetical protein U1F36_15410 [Planctomycetota bacterium]
MPDRIPTRMQAIRHHAGAACAALFLALALPAQLAPGAPRAFLVANGAANTHSLGHVACGDFDGDHRGDAAIVVDGELVLVMAASGFGAQHHLATPGDGVVRDCVAVAATATGLSSILFTVTGGTDPGLYLCITDGSAVPTARKLDSTTWCNVGKLVAASTQDGTELFGLGVDGDSIARGVFADDHFAVTAPIDAGLTTTDLRVSPWQSAEDLALFVVKEAEIHVLDLLGREVGTIATSNAMVDFDVALSAELRHGRLVRITRDSGGASVLDAIDPDGSLVQTIDLLGLHPRILLDDVFQRGALDVVGVSTVTPLGFACFSGLGAEPGSFVFDPISTVLFGFDSPNFADAPSHSNIAMGDLDQDGDRDAIFCDEATNTIRVQPSWAVDEIDRAPHAVQFTPIYSYQVFGAQKFEFEYAVPAGLLVVPSHIELSLYQKKVVGGVLQHLLLGSTVVPATASTAHQGAVTTGEVVVFAVYDGPEGTDADWVAVARFLHADAGGTAWDWYGVDGFTAFHHHRTPSPHYPGYYLGGTVGGTNPLPTVIGSGITAPGSQPPLPPPPSGG